MEENGSLDPVARGIAELDRLQREVQQSFDISPSIRGLGRGGFPALNVGGTPQSVEIYAFTPGLDPAKLEVNLDRGVLTIAGERKSDLPASDVKATSRNERQAHSAAFCPCPTTSTPTVFRPSTATAFCTSVSSGAKKRSHAASAFSNQEQSP
jgi:HSP20 family molecular chaperone IbpA